MADHLLAWCVEWHMPFRTACYTGVVVESGGNGQEIDVLEFDYDEIYKLKTDSSYAIKRPALNEYLLYKLRRWKLLMHSHMPGDRTADSKLLQEFLSDELTRIKEYSNNAIMKEAIESIVLANSVQNLVLEYINDEYGSVDETCHYDTVDAEPNKGGSSGRKGYISCGSSSESEGAESEGGSSESDEENEDEGEDEDDSDSDEESDDSEDNDSSEDEEENSDTSDDDEDDSDDNDDDESVIDLKVVVSGFGCSSDRGTPGSQNQVRGFSVPRATAFTAVMKRLKKDYSSKPELFYVDEEGDKVNILAASDFKYALRCHKLRWQVSPTAADTSVASGRKEEPKLKLVADFSKNGTGTAIPSAIPSTMHSGGDKNNKAGELQRSGDRTFGVFSGTREVFDTENQRGNGSERDKTAVSDNCNGIHNGYSNGSYGNAIYEGPRGICETAATNDRNNAIANDSSSDAAQFGNTTSEMLWQRGELLGSGSFGQVFSGINLTSGVKIAVKEVRLGKGKRQEQQAQALQREIKILGFLDHPNIIRYLGTEHAGDTMRIFLELATEGSVKDILREFGALAEPIVRKYTLDIVSGLSFLHSKRFIHRDLKPSNLLVSNGVVKVADFGCSTGFDFHGAGNGKGVGGSPSDSGHVTVAGTTIYMAPEVMRAEGGDGRRSGGRERGSGRHSGRGSAITRMGSRMEHLSVDVPLSPLSQMNDSDTSLSTGAGGSGFASPFSWADGGIPMSPVAVTVPADVANAACSSDKGLVGNTQLLESQATDASSVEKPAVPSSMEAKLAETSPVPSNVLLSPLDSAVRNATAPAAVMSVSIENIGSEVKDELQPLPSHGKKHGPNGSVSAVGSPGSKSKHKHHKHSSGYGRKADVWSLGVTLCEMATGSAPYRTAAAAIYSVCVTKQFPTFPAEMSSDAHDFLSRCLCEDSKQRASCVELLTHRFLGPQSEADLRAQTRHANSRHTRSTVSFHLTDVNFSADSKCSDTSRCEDSIFNDKSKNTTEGTEKRGRTEIADGTGSESSLFYTGISDVQYVSDAKEIDRSSMLGATQTVSHDDKSAYYTASASFPIEQAKLSEKSAK